MTNVTSGADSIGHGGTFPPLLQMAGHGGTVSNRTTDQTVLTITKALLKTTNCTFRAKIVEGHDQKKIFFPALCAGSVSPHFRSRPVPPLSNSIVPAPLNVTE